MIKLDFRISREERCATLECGGDSEDVRVREDMTGFQLESSPSSHSFQ